MKNFMKSIWMRALAPIICTISALGLATTILLVVIYSQFGGTEHAYRNIYVDIANNYALYAIDMIESDQVDALKTYLDEREIACTVTKQMVDEAHEVLPESQTVVFSTGEVRNTAWHELEMVEGADYYYDISSLMAIIYGEGFYSAYGDTTSLDVKGVVFDKDTGFFYYETDRLYFKVEDVVVYQDGVYMDYSLTKLDGVECYYNGYYQQKLDSAQHEMWYAIRIDEKEFTFGEEKGFENEIYVTDASEIEAKGVGTHVVFANIRYVEYYPTDYVSTYMVQIDWREDVASVDSLFTEWYTLCNKIMELEKYVLPNIILSFIGLFVGVVLLLASLIDKKEALGVLHKAPLMIYSGIIFLTEFGLLALVLEGIPAVVRNYGKGSAELWVVSSILITGVGLWLGIIWFQNIVTRLKCRSFWKTTEVYYVYKLLKNSWHFITRPIKWCWEKVSTTFKTIAREIKSLLERASRNTSFIVGGVVGFITLAFIELCCCIGVINDGTEFLVILFFIKLLEGLVVFYVFVHMQDLHEGSKRVAAGDTTHRIDTHDMFWKFKEHAENINKVSDGIVLAVEERMKSEHFKTELITNVSHDIKTPLTSIINYVDLIKKEEVHDEKLVEYIDVLDRQSARLKKLIEDLMEASKASTGNLTVNLEVCDVDVLLSQVIGEFEERLQKNRLEVVVNKPEQSLKMMADGRHMWRVLDNLLNNACKYSLPGTRVYVSLEQEANFIKITFKNISKEALNIPSDALMERFVRGDSSRNTEGSGLGLSIAQSLTELMKGSMKLEIDGDLFKATLTFPII